MQACPRMIWLKEVKVGLLGALVLFGLLFGGYWYYGVSADQEKGVFSSLSFDFFSE